MNRFWLTVRWVFVVSLGLLLAWGLYATTCSVSIRWLRAWGLLYWLSFLTTGAITLRVWVSCFAIHAKQSLLYLDQPHNSIFPPMDTSPIWFKILEMHLQTGYKLAESIKSGHKSWVDVHSTYKVHYKVPNEVYSSEQGETSRRRQVNYLCITRSLQNNYM